MKALSSIPVTAMAAMAAIAASLVAAPRPAVAAHPSESSQTPAITTVQVAPPAAAPRASAPSVRSRTAVPGFRAVAPAAYAQSLRMALAPLPSTRISLDLNNAPVRDALRQVFEQAKQEYTIDADVPAETRISMKVKDVQFGTSLDLLTQAAGVRWGRETKEGKTVFRVGKSVMRSTVFGYGDNSLSLSGVEAFTGNSPLLYRYSTTEERSTFTCPHCKNQTTVLRARQAHKCTQCQQTFQNNWQFCPNDGVKRPASKGTWQFCPVCGKKVSFREGIDTMESDTGSV